MNRAHRIEKTAWLLLEKHLISKKDLVLFTAGVYSSKSGSTNLIEIHRIDDMIKSISD